MVKYNDKNEWIYVLILAMVQFIHLVDFVIMMPLGPRFMIDFNISPTLFASLVSSYNFAGGASAIILGTFADKFDRKKLLIIMALGLAIGTLLCGLAESFHTLLIARIISGTFGGMVGALILAIISDIIPFERRGKAMGTLMTAFSVASVLGIPIGLYIADLYGWKACFYAITSFIFIICILVAVTFPNLKVQSSSVGGLKAIKRYYDFVFVKGYGLSFLFMFCVSMSMFIIIPFLAPYAVKNMGIAVHHIKYMYLVGGLCTILTARVIGIMTDKLGAFKVFTMIAIGSSVPVLLYTNSGPVGLIPYLIIGSFFMIMVSGRMIPCMTLISEVPNPEERGGYMGVVNSLRAFGSASSTFIGGYVITESTDGKLIGFSQAGILSILVTLFACFLGYKLLQKKNQIN